MATSLSVIAADNLDTPDASQLREMVVRLKAEVLHKQALVDKLTHENAVLKRLKFAAQSERFSGEQRSLIEETLDADLQAVSDEIEKLQAQDEPARERKVAKRQPLPADLPRREIRHEPESTTCSCGCQMKRIGEDVAEKLDYRPGVFTSATCAASGPARNARSWCRRRCRRTSSTKACRPLACSRRCWSPSSPITCRYTGRKRSSAAPAWRSRDRHWPSGSEAAAQLQPLVDAMRSELLAQRVLHADETPVAMLGRRRQDAPSLPVDVLQYGAAGHQAGGVRLRREPREPTSDRVPGSPG